MEANTFFSNCYKEAREKFLAAADKSGGRVESFKHPELGPEGELLFVDVAYFGAVNNTNALVVISGTHGVEGFAGSGIQTGLMQQGFASNLPSNLSLVLIHALNPFGMAHLRRFTEDNIDLNRNFGDHSLPSQSNLPYEQLSDAIAPCSISFWHEIKSWWRIIGFRLTAGNNALQQAVSQGQYSYPKGLFYGGTSKTWSNATIHSIVQRYLHDATKVVIVDVHTGLGQFANAELILNSPISSPEYQRAIDIWGKERIYSTDAGESVSVHINTAMKMAFPKMLPDSEITAVALEFGTLPPMKIFKALRTENWLHHYGCSEFAKANKIKTSLLRAFYPDNNDWKKAVWEIGRKVIESAVVSFH